MFLGMGNSLSLWWFEDKNEERKGMQRRYRSDGRGWGDIRLSKEGELLLYECKRWSMKEREGVEPEWKALCL